MQSVPDPSWKVNGPPEDGFATFSERWWEQTDRDMQVGDLLDRCPLALRKKILRGFGEANDSLDARPVQWLLDAVDTDLFHEIHAWLAYCCEADFRAALEGK